MALGEALINAVVIAAVSLATVTDLRARKIPNVLTLTALILGLVLNAAFFGADGLRSSGLGGAIGLGLLFPLWMLKGVGAGDVKLIAALGVLKGPEFVVFTCLWAGVVGGFLALYGLIRSQKLGLALAHLYYFKGFPRPNESFITAGKFPYAPAIAVGAALVLAGVRWIGA